MVLVITTIIAVSNRAFACPTWFPLTLVISATYSPKRVDLALDAYHDTIHPRFKFVELTLSWIQPLLDWAGKAHLRNHAPPDDRLTLYLKIILDSCGCSRLLP